MNLQRMTKEELILLDLEASSKEEVIGKIVHALYKENFITSEKEFLKSVMEREKHSPTGLEDGLAIPHGKSKAVKRAAFGVARLKNKISSWESISENNQVELVFLLAIPEEEAGSTHLKLLAELSTALMNKDFVNRLRKAKNAKEFIEALDYNNERKEEEPKYSKTVLAITACAAGIAHTYMAAEALEKAGKEMGVRVLVEKQGANGIENAHTKELIEKADGVIFATDIVPKNVERFNGSPM